MGAGFKEIPNEQPLGVTDVLISNRVVFLERVLRKFLQPVI
jgi:hypothetical protein